MSTFVLIHGAWHGGWVWQRVAQQLRSASHTVHAPDLPGHGEDKTPVQQVTLQAYVQRALDVIDSCRETVVLAGHSMGGLVISQAAEQRPERIRALVYVCAFLLKNGQTLGEAASKDTAALVMPNTVFSPDQKSVTLRPEILREVFYGDCSEEDYQRARSLLVPQATAPFVTALHLSETNYGSIPRVYVECVLDRAITLPAQRAMHLAAGCHRVFTLQSSHSPFFSKPAELAEALLFAASLDKTKALGQREAGG
jgi:pimeloyl-ACP methyl ester carboxylesterase